MNLFQKIGFVVLCLSISFSILAINMLAKANWSVLTSWPRASMGVACSRLWVPGSTQYRVEKHGLILCNFRFAPAIYSQNTEDTIHLNKRGQVILCLELEAFHTTGPPLKSKIDKSLMIKKRLTFNTHVCNCFKLINP